ncbi:hypothetical protein Syun_023383 [Stephania yunnanensis]|uniref:Uncharacterized protein n=1 Tax=Stephania yunnanensis TaxID=152371 RepID=A0AAP0FI21_9MAGN
MIRSDSDSSVITIHVVSWSSSTHLSPRLNTTVQQTLTPPRLRLTPPLTVSLPLRLLVRLSLSQSRLSLPAAVHSLSRRASLPCRLCTLSASHSLSRACLCPPPFTLSVATDLSLPLLAVDLFRLSAARPLSASSRRPSNW